MRVSERAQRRAKYLTPPIGLLFLVAMACGAGAARPRFEPFPEATSDTFPLAPDSAAIRIGEILRDEGVELEHFRPREGYVETKWYDMSVGRTVSASSLNTQSVVRFRFWTDPAAEGRSTVIGEAARRSRIDPSQPVRETERPVPTDHPAAELIQRVFAALRTERQS
jgi:hypothetical protein